jgi:hypothetical protein
MRVAVQQKVRAPFMCLETDCCFPNYHEFVVFALCGVVWKRLWTIHARVIQRYLQPKDCPLCQRSRDENYDIKYCVRCLKFLGHTQKCQKFSDDDQCIY